MNLRETRIWIGSDRKLQQKVFNRLKELGVNTEKWDDLECDPHGFYISDTNRLTFASDDKRYGYLTCKNRYQTVTVEELLGSTSTGMSKSLIDFGDED